MICTWNPLASGKLTTWTRKGKMIHAKMYAYVHVHVSTIITYLYMLVCMSTYANAPNK
jgi:hypothetical protein